VTIREKYEAGDYSLSELASQDLHFVVVFFVVRAVCYFCHVVIVLVCHVVTKIVLDEMGHLLTLLEEMGLDEMGLDEMG